MAEFALALAIFSLAALALAAHRGRRQHPRKYDAEQFVHYRAHAAITKFMKRKYESQRGAILVESALVVGAIFLMLFGTVFVAIIGFDQMSADGASYEVAHQTSVGAAAPPAASHQIFPNIPQAQITTQIQPAPMQSISVDYGYNVAAEASASANDRHGGVAMMQGTQVNGAASKTSSSILGMPIGVLGNMVEPMWLENGVHFDAQNSNSYGGTTPVCSATAPPGPSPGTPPPCFQGNIFTSGENVPPYYVGYNFMTHCADNLPFAMPYSQTNTTICSAENFIPLGVGEYLDHDNWCTSASSASCTIANAGIAGSAPGDSTFATISCHQRVYAKIAAFFGQNQGASALQQIYRGQGGSSIPNSYGYSAAPAFFFYNQYTAHSGVAKFQLWAGYDTTLSNEQADASQVTTGPVDAAIREVYNWDGGIVSGRTGGGALNPGLGC